MKPDPLSFPDQSQNKKCVSVVIPCYELSRTQKIRNSDTKVERSHGISKRPGSESEREILYLKFIFRYTCECRWILHEIQDKSKAVRSVVFSLQR